MEYKTTSVHVLDCDFEYFIISQRKQEFQTPENQQEEPTKKPHNSTKNGCKCQLFKIYPENVEAGKNEL